MLLEAVELSKTYGSVRAVDELSLTLEEGEAFCMLGPNGAGKTTTINLFLGFIRPTSGTARVKGIDVVADPLAARARLAYVPEDVQLYPQLSGVENLAYFLSLAAGAVPPRSELGRMLVEVGLPEEAAIRRASGYSKGMRQKVALALTLLRKADVLILDEPTTGLDPGAVRELAGVLERMRDSGTAIFMVTHDLTIACAVASRVGVMRRGRLVDVVSPTCMTSEELAALCA